MGKSYDKNERSWDKTSDAYQETHGRALSGDPMAWGVWRIPDTEVGALGEIAGCDVLELGCGAAQWSIALAGRGARVIGVDLSGRQLGHAAESIRESGKSVPLVNADAEYLPLASSSFDVVFCDHGAMSFASPDRTVPEVARVLRAGGRFVFCNATPIYDTCWDPSDDAIKPRLSRNYFTLDRLEDDELITYQRPYGKWIRLFGRSGFVVEDLIELRPAADATTTYDDYVPLDWARQWPAEHIWKLRKP